MPLSQLHLPSFTVVLTSDHGSTILRDFQRAQSREIQIPIFGPQDDGLLVGSHRYRCSVLFSELLAGHHGHANADRFCCLYTRAHSKPSHKFAHFRVLTESSVQRDQDTATLFEDNIQTADAKGFYWVRTSDWFRRV